VKTIAEMKWWRPETAILAGAVLIALSILFIGRWQISAFGDTHVYRLDRWTGEIEYCGIWLDKQKWERDGTFAVMCPLNLKKVQSEK